MEKMQYTDMVDSALAELIGLQNRSLHYTPGTTTLSSSPSYGCNSAGSSNSSRKFVPHYTCISSPSVNHQNVQMPPKYISKILSSPRKEPPFRMRPYFIPERSRTKSETLDCSVILPEGDSEFHSLCSFSTCTTASTSYATMSASLMDTGGGGGGSNSRSPGILMPQNSFNYENVNDARGYSMEPRKMRLKKLNVLKKSRSMEDVRAEAVDGSQMSHEMEFVSSRIQKLKVQEPE